MRDLRNPILTMADTEEGGHHIMPAQPSLLIKPRHTTLHRVSKIGDGKQQAKTVTVFHTRPMRRFFGTNRIFLEAVACQNGDHRISVAVPGVRNPWILGNVTESRPWSSRMAIAGKTHPGCYFLPSLNSFQDRNADILQF